MRTGRRMPWHVAGRDRKGTWLQCLTTVDALQNVALRPLSNPILARSESDSSMSPANSQGSSSHICRSLRACVCLSFPHTGDRSRGDAGPVCRDDGMHQECHSPSALANQQLNNVSSAPSRSAPPRTAKAFGDVFPYCF